MEDRCIYDNWPACAVLEELCETAGAAPDPATSSTIASLQGRGRGGEGAGRGEDRLVLCVMKKGEKAPEFPRMRVGRSPTQNADSDAATVEG
jgi:hypothetical protein